MIWWPLDSGLDNQYQLVCILSIDRWMHVIGTQWLKSLVKALIGATHVWQIGTVFHVSTLSILGLTKTYFDN